MEFHHWLTSWSDRVKLIIMTFINRRMLTEIIIRDRTLNNWTAWQRVVYEFHGNDRSRRPSLMLHVSRITVWYSRIHNCRSLETLRGNRLNSETDHTIKVERNWLKLGSRNLAVAWKRRGIWIDQVFSNENERTFFTSTITRRAIVKSIYEMNPSNKPYLVSQH